MTRDEAAAFLRLVLPLRSDDETYRAELFDAPKGTPFWSAYLDVGRLAQGLLGAGQLGNAFFSPVTFKRGARRREEDALRCKVLWADLDVCTAGEKTHHPNHYKSLDEALTAVENLALKPHAVLLTGHGVLAVWRLVEAVDGGDLARLIRLVRGIANRWRADPNVALTTQLLRLPGTKNFDPKRKKDGTTRPVTLQRMSPELLSYTLDDFAKAGVPEVEAKGKVPPAQPDPSLGNGKVVPAPRISPRMKALLTTPGQEGYASASEADAAVTTALLGAGVAPADAMTTFLDSPRGQDAADRKRGHLMDYVERTVTSAQAHVERDHDVQPVAPSVPSEATSPAAYVFRCLDELLASEDEPLDVVIGDGAEGAVLTAGGKGMVAGPTGIGKTNLLLRMDRSLCEGTPFLGLPIPRPRRVLHLALEGSPHATKRRLRKIWAGAAEDAAARFFIAHIQLNLANETDLARLDQLLYTVRPEVLVIDPLRNAHPWDENKSDEMAQLTAILDAIIARHSCAIICAHHDRKKPPFTKSDAGTDRVRGSTALTGWLSFCLCIDPDVVKDRLVLHWAKTRDAEEALEPIVADFERDSIDFIINNEVAAEGKVPDDAILTAVFRAGPEGIRGTDLFVGFVEGAGASDRWVRQRVRALVKKKKLTEFVPLEEKKGAKWYRIAGVDEGRDEP